MVIELQLYTLNLTIFIVFGLVNSWAAFVHIFLLVH